MITKVILLTVITACCVLAGCKNSLLDRSLVFFTNTTIGVEISVSPSDATSPVRLIIGYKRAEGVLNPVYHSEGVEVPVTTENAETLTAGSSYADKEAAIRDSRSYSRKWSTSEPIAGGPKTIKRYRPEAYSVIAKIAGDVSGNAGETAQGKLSVAQWFATGEAAKILAKQPGIAGAVTGSSEIAKAAMMSNFGGSTSGQTWVADLQVFVYIYTALYERGKAGDIKAKQHVRNIDTLGSLVPDEYINYKWKNPAPAIPLLETTINPIAANQAIWGKVFDSVTTYYGSLDSNIVELSDALIDRAFEYRPEGATAKSTADNNLKLTLKNLRQVLVDKKANLEKEFSENQIVITAVQYYFKTLLQ